MGRQMIGIKLVRARAGQRAVTKATAELASQAVYNLRDCIPADETKLWFKLNSLAGWLGRMGVVLGKGEPLPPTMRYTKWSIADIKRAMRGARSQLQVAARLGGSPGAIRKRCLRESSLKDAWLKLGARGRAR